MTRLDFTNSQQLAEEFETTIEAYECARLAGHNVEIASLLHMDDARQRAELACELIRIDLEVAYDRGEHRQLDAYRTTTPELFDYADLLAQVAFEHWRLRNDKGEAVEPGDYLDQLALSPSDWPISLTSGEGSQSPADFPQIGESFDSMPLAAVIGTGAFSRVYIAHQPWCANRQVVLKVTTKKSVEPDRMGKLQHTNIVPIYSLHFDWGLLGVCMPLLGRETLATCLDSQFAWASTQNIGPGGSTVDENCGDSSATVSPATIHGHSHGRLMAWRGACEIGLQLARGLQHAHAAGIVHGDIKPANILLGDDGIPRLLDFNLSRDMASPSTDNGPVGGTLPFMSPQQLAGMLARQPPEYRDDIYSLGAVLYTLLAGTPPFVTPLGALRDTVPTMIAARNAGVVPLRRVSAEIPPSTAAIVEKCLAADANLRYQSAAELADELERQLRDEPLKLTREPSNWERICKAVRRNRVALGRTLAVLAFLVAVATGLSAWRSSQRASLLAQQARADQFHELFAEASRLLCVPSADDDLRERGVAVAVEAIESVGLGKGASVNFTRAIPSEDQAQILNAVDLMIAYVDADSLRVDERSLAQNRRQWPTSKLASESSLGGAMLTQRQQAFQLLGDGRFAEAKEFLERLVGQYPHDATLWLELGTACAATREYEQSLAAFTAAQAIAPECPLVWRHRAYLSIDRARYDDALRDLKVASRLSPDSPAVAMNRSIALLGMGQFAIAETTASEAIDNGMQLPRAYLVRARCRRLQGKEDDAQHDEATALSIKPIDAEDWAARAIVLANTDHDRAMMEIERGLEKFPKSIVLLRNKLHILADVRGENEQALAICKELCRVLPDSISEQLGLAVCHARLAQFEEAGQIAAAVESEVASPIDRLQLACVYSLLTRHKSEYRDRSLKCLQRALASQPSLVHRASNDPDLEVIRVDQDYLRLVAAARQLLSSMTHELSAVE